jgi:uncharacterized membrane protein YdfJ with MMPL/SSD domain
LAAAIVVLLIAFGSFVAMGLPVGTALLGLGAAFSVIALASQLIDMPNFAGQLAAMIGLGVGLDYALLIATRFRENRRGWRRRSGRDGLRDGYPGTRRAVRVLAETPRSSSGGQWLQPSE